MSQTEEWIPNVEQVDGDGRRSMGYVRSLIAEGRHEDAIDELRGMISREPSNVQAVMGLGLTYLGLGRLEDAAQQFETAMGLDPEGEAPAMLAAQVGVRGNNPAYAEANYHKALERNPNSVNAIQGLVRLHLRNRNLSEAIEAQERAVEIDPEAKLLRTSLAVLLTQADRVGEACAQYEYILSLHPGDPQTTSLLAGLYADTGRSDDAMRILRQAMRTSPNDESLQITLGYLHLKREEFVDAERVLRAIVANEDREPGFQAPAADDGARRPVANFFRWVGGIFSRRPRNVARLLLAQALTGQGKTAEARDVLIDMPRTGAIGISVHRRFGDSFLADGAKEAALDSYKAALRQLDGGLAIIDAVETETPGMVIDDKIHRFIAEIERLQKRQGDFFSQTEE